MENSDNNKKETNEKLDNILNTTLKKCKLSMKNKSASTELLTKAESLENLSEEEKTYILEKFLDNTTIGVKPPVPRPRKLKRIPTNESSSSKKTFNVELQKLNDSQSSKATYNVNEPIGDVLLHNSPPGTKIAVISNTSSPEHIEKAEIERLTDVSSPSKSEKSIPKKASPDIESVKEEIELKELPKSIDNDVTNVASVTYEKIVEIVVHKTDKLKLNSFVTHPVVKIHVVDSKSGKYYKKSDKTRNVVFYYENKETDYILPVMTQCYNLQEKRSIIPQWEEKILLNEDHNYLFKENVIIFFEIMDFPSTSLINVPKFDKKSFKGWHRIAFAFLKIIGKNGAENFNKKIRLQLYYSNIDATGNGNECYVWKWWKDKKLKKYPSTLYVTVKAVLSPQQAVDAFRSKTPLQKENAIQPIVNNEKGSSLKSEDDLLKFNNRLKKSSSIILPKDCVKTIDCYEDGCFLLKFSNSGQFLAASMQINNKFFVVVFSVTDFEEVRRFLCHNGMIYNISWSKNDELIITASADNTVSIWDFKQSLFLQILPHPKFVYSCDIHENDIATGCFDHVLRIWRKNGDQFDLYQELEMHKGYITSICFGRKTNYLYSADSVGCVNIWQKNDDKWMFFKDLSLIDIKNVTISQILLFKNEKKLVIHSRDSTIRIVSLKNFYVLHCLQGALNRRVQTFCSLSACNTFILSGDESSLGVVWNTKTGENVKTYNFYPEDISTVIHCVQFHPNDSLFAVSHYGKNFPILIYQSTNNEDNNVSIKSVGRRTGALNQIDGKKIILSDIIHKIDQVLNVVN